MNQREKLKAINDIIELSKINTIENEKLPETLKFIVVPNDDTKIKYIFNEFKIESSISDFLGYIKGFFNKLFNLNKIPYNIYKINSNENETNLRTENIIFTKIHEKNIKIGYEYTFYEKININDILIFLPKTFAIISQHKYLQKLNSISFKRKSFINYNNALNDGQFIIFSKIPQKYREYLLPKINEYMPYDLNFCKLNISLENITLASIDSLPDNKVIIINSSIEDLLSLGFRFKLYLNYSFNYSFSLKLLFATKIENISSFILNKFTTFKKIINKLFETFKINGIQIAKDIWNILYKEFNLEKSHKHISIILKQNKVLNNEINQEKQRYRSILIELENEKNNKLKIIEDQKQEKLNNQNKKYNNIKQQIELLKNDKEKLIEYINSINL